MKKYFVFTILIIAILSFCACSKAEIVSTVLGDFEYSQTVQDNISDSQEVNTYTASAGNILLIVYLTPAKDNGVTMDQASEFFSSGSQAVVDSQTYDKVCLVYEKSGATLRYGLVFEITDNKYDNNHQPVVSNLILPTTLSTPAPETTAAPTLAPTTAPTDSSSASATASASTVPTAAAS
jgi:hypothetical protein